MTSPAPDHWSVKHIIAERASAVAPFGLTVRQARFVVTVMLHSGVFVSRQYCAFAGITHGQKVHDFVEKLLARRLATATTIGSQQRVRIFHVQHKPLHAAIGEPDNRNRKPVALGRAIERLMILDGVLADSTVTWLGAERDKRRYFILRLGDRLDMHDYPRLVFGTAPMATIRYFPDKLPIGFEPHGRRHVFIYLPTSQAPMDYRLFLLRHAELLHALGHWTIRVLIAAAGGQRQHGSMVRGVSDPHLARCSWPRARPRGSLTPRVNVFVLNRCVRDDIVSRSTIARSALYLDPAENQVRSNSTQ